MLNKIEHEEEIRDFDRWQADAHFRDAYEVAFGVRPVFSVTYLSDVQLQIRTAYIREYSGVYPG